MAVVNVDLSEYDALRESEREAKQRIKKLEAELEGLKSGDKAIIVSKRYDKKFNPIDIASSVVKFMNSLADPFVRYRIREDMIIPLQNALSTVLSRYNEIATENSYYLTESTTEIKGFDDIRMTIENKFRQDSKRDIDDLKNSLKEAQEKYINKYNSVYKEASKRADEEYKAIISDLRESVKARDTEVDDLIIKVSNLNKELEKTKEKLSITEEEKKMNAGYKEKYTVCKSELLRTRNEKDRLLDVNNDLKATVDELNRKIEDKRKEEKKKSFFKRIFS